MSTQKSAGDKILEEFARRSLDQMASIQSAVNDLRNDMNIRDARLDQRFNKVDQELNELKAEMKSMHQVSSKEDKEIGEKIVSLQIENVTMKEQTKGLEKQFEENKTKRGIAAASIGGAAGAVVTLVEWIVRNL